MVELASFYGVQFLSAEKVKTLLKCLEKSADHEAIFDFTLYYAAWIKSELKPEALIFEDPDDMFITIATEECSL